MNILNLNQQDSEKNSINEIYYKYKDDEFAKIFQNDPFVLVTTEYIMNLK